jgi:hypothetical protein
MEDFMREYLPIIMAFCAVLLGASTTKSQTTVNPDISAIADTRFIDRRNAPEEIGPNKPQFEFNELELAVSGYLNPYARADAIFSVAGSGQTDIEEAYATLLRGLPWNLQIKAGKYLVDFGKLNTQHAHQWSWIDRPLMFQRFFGEEGLKGTGINVTTLVPIGASAFIISSSILQGGFLESTIGSDLTSPLASNTRVSLFAPLSGHSEIEFGFSGLFVQHDLLNKRWATLGDFDFKYKWKPDKYHSLILVGEGLTGSRKISPDTLNFARTKKVSSSGMFAAADYQFRRRYDAGAFIDYSQNPTDSHDDQTGYGVFAGFSLAEETYRIGFLLRQDKATMLSRSYQTAEIQLLWALGPHKPHQF